MKRFLLGFVCGIAAMNIVTVGVTYYLRVSENHIRRKAIGL